MLKERFSSLRETLMRKESTNGGGSGEEGLEGTGMQTICTKGCTRSGALTLAMTGSITASHTWLPVLAHLVSEGPFLILICLAAQFSALVAITIGCAKVPLIRSWDSKMGIAEVGDYS